jgi:ATP-binding cassette subfamily B protein
MGHFMEHGNLYLNPEFCAGDMMRLQKYSDMGGIDAVFSQFVWGKRVAYDPPCWQTPKLGSSISHAYGKPDDTRSEIIAAARAAHAHEFILRLPQGYDSMVGERGQGLSGGERQRISIARALLIDPRILILDEATSSVDSETEKEIQKALENLVKGRTTIAIAHRLSTLHRADRLVVLDRGRVVEEGTHDALMAKEGAYFNLYQAQARNMDVDMDAAR